MIQRYAAWVATLALMFAPADARAEEDVQLVAGEALVLVHPQINKSVGNPVLCLAFVDNGGLLATGATSGVLVWDTSSGQLRQTLEVDDRAVDTLALDPSGTRLVAGGASGIIKVWDARSLKPLMPLEKTSGAVRGLTISGNGKLLATASPNGQLGAADPQFGVVIWDLAKGGMLRTIPHPSPEFGITLLAFLPGSRQLLSAQDRTFRVIDVDQGEVVKTIDARQLPRSLGSLALRPDGKHLVTGVFEPMIRLWDTETWQQTLAWEAHYAQPPPRRSVATVNYSPDGRYVLSGGMDGMACVWDAATGRRLLELDARGDVSARWLTGVAMSSDNRWLAASHYGGTATVWRIAAPK